MRKRSGTDKMCIHQDIWHCVTRQHCTLGGGGGGGEGWEELGDFSQNSFLSFIFSLATFYLCCETCCSPHNLAYGI